MRIPLLAAIAVATLAAGTAQAQVVGGDGPYAGGDGGVEIVTNFPPVKTDIVISGAGGAATETLSCEWTEPQEDDRQCLRFQSDPQVAFAKIEESRGVRADQHTVTEGADMTIAYSKRADGSWLIRSKGTIDGRFMHFGRVCTADGQSCVRWDADGAKAARSSVKAAASKLKQKRR
jgi:hypothetical protein